MTCAAYVGRALCVAVLWGAAVSVMLAAEEKLPEGAQLTALESQPSSIELKHRFDYRQLLLTGTLAGGERVDVTRMVTIDKSADVVEVSPHGLLRPKADGTAELKITLADQSLSVPVAVTGTQADFPVSFVRDAMPTMSKLGCNAGTCHGSAQGKNGFKLSLRGYDPLFDHRALTDDLAGRRFNRAAPEQSLMLLKPIGAVPHVGGAPTKPGEPAYELLKAWITQGLKLDLDSPRVAKIEVAPINPVIPLPGMKQQMVVTATYSDGTQRDVSAEAFIESGNIEITEASRDGIVTALRRGESPVLVRFEGAYAATTITVMDDRTGFVFQRPPENNYIDQLVYNKLERMKTQPGNLCNDAEFIRRLYLDLTGLPPTADQVRAFLADERETRVKRDELIDRLVGSPEYVEHWTNRWADLLQVNSKYLAAEGAAAFREWIRQAVAGNMPYDKFVHAVLTGSGSNLENPPASYYKIHRVPDEVMENTTQLFLAIRFNCNKCHDHPFERWTQNQHWQLAAFFAPIARKEDPKFAGRKVGGTDVEAAVPEVEVIFDAPDGGSPVKHPTTQEPQQATFPYQHAAMPPVDAPLRQRFADWTVASDNQYFATSYVNRLWSYLTGVGFIEPIDDIRAGNPPTNPELLQKLTDEFISTGFDMQHMLRLMCKSRTYQNTLETNQWNEDDTINYSHAIARRLPAEVLYDAVFQATGSTRRLTNMPAGARAAEQRDPTVGTADGFLDLFGRPPRESACECERSSGVMLGQTLNLINGPTLAEAISDPNNDLPKLLGSQPDNAKLVEELFLRIMSRYPTPAEIEVGVKSLDGSSYETDHAALVAQLAEYEKTLPPKQAEWEKEAGKLHWIPLVPSSVTSAAGATFEIGQDHTVFAIGNLAKDAYTVAVPTELPTISGFRLEVLADPRLPHGGPGRSPEDGNLVVSEFRVTAAVNSDPTQQRAVVFQRVLADHSQANYDIAAMIDGNPETGWAVAPLFNKNHVAVLEAAEDLQLSGGAVLTFTLDQQFTSGQHAVGKFRLSATSAKRPLRLDEGHPPHIAAIVQLPAEQRGEQQQAELTAYFRSLDGEYNRLSQAVVAHANERPNARLHAAQDLVWALLNNSAFLFNR